MSTRRARDIERVERKSVRRYHETVDAIPSTSDGYEGEMRFLRRSDGKFDQVVKLPDGWVKRSMTATSLEIASDDDGIPELRVEINGKNYKVKLEEVT